MLAVLDTLSHVQALVWLLQLFGGEWAFVKVAITVSGMLVSVIIFRVRRQRASDRATRLITSRLRAMQLLDPKDDHVFAMFCLPDL